MREREREREGGERERETESLINQLITRFDIHVSVHANIFPNYNQQDAMFLDLFISTDALHASGGSIG